MTDRTWTRLGPFETGLSDRRSGDDRRQDGDRRRLDVFKETGRPCFELRAGADRRSGADRRHPVRLRAAAEEIVTPWQLPEAPTTVIDHPTA